MIKILLILLFLVFNSCFDKDNVTGSTDKFDTKNKIKLSGRVLDKNNDPASGIIVKLALKGVSDTTGSDGRYLIQGELPEADSVKQSRKDVLDTIIISQGSQQVASITVVKWIDTLPDVKSVQFGFSVDLPSTENKIRKIEAVLTGDGIPEGQPVESDFFYNKPANEYSGLLYFPAREESQNFEIYIILYDIDGNFLGRSDNIRFNSTAVDITIPTFNVGC